VLKADVLAAGKGVIIAADEREARDAVDASSSERRFGETEVVLEEFLEGEELSLLALCDGERSCRCPGQTTSASSTAITAPTQVGWAATRRCRGIDSEHAHRSHARGPPADRRRAAPARHPYHGVLYAG